jgi:hypothetical protein
MKDPILVSSWSSSAMKYRFQNYVNINLSRVKTGIEMLFCYVMLQKNNLQYLVVGAGTFVFIRAVSHTDILYLSTSLSFVFISLHQHMSLFCFLLAVKVCYWNRDENVQWALYQHQNKLIPRITTCNFNLYAESWFILLDKPHFLS